MASDIERVRRLAKATAKMTDATVAIWQNEDGTYDFRAAESEITKDIIEYITPY
jgi:hypothetical protein